MNAILLAALLTQQTLTVPIPVQIQRLPALMDSAGVVGLSIGFLRDGDIEWAKGFGFRSVNDSAAVDEHTVFEAASLSKPVVAYAALKLADAGLLELDRPLTAYTSIPELRDPQVDRITARMVLSHTTGLQNERFGNQPLVFAFPPGARFRYSGEGFQLLQRALEAITGESLDELTQRLVFKPLGMTNSAFIWQERLAHNAAVGHGDFKTPRRPTRPRAARAASSLHTTAHDYALFARAMLRREGLQSQTFEHMVTPQVNVAPAIEWGLGWALDTADKPPAIWHWGDNSNSGFTAFVWLNFQSRRGVVYFTNSSTGLSMVRRLLALAGGGEAAAVFMNYETHDAAARKVRHAIEAAVRERGAAAGLRTYESLKRQFEAAAFSESLLNTLGYRFLALNRPHDAVALFKRNVEAFPNSSNVYDSLGDGLVAVGDKQAAIASYLKSYELDPRNERALKEAERLRAVKPN